MKTSLAWATLGLAGAAAFAPGHAALAADKHVLLISVDGLHAQDVTGYVRSHPQSTFAALLAHGAEYTNAATTQPSDSFPGTIGEATGGTPRVTGVFYDNSFDRALLPPPSRNAGDKPGAEIVLDEYVDKDDSRLDAGGGIDESKLPRDPKTGKPVYPHQYLRVNTIFEVARKHGLRTAWSDKHPAYDILNGPSGRGIEDLYTPEIASVDASDLKNMEQYDTLKVDAILNEIDGYDHARAKQPGTPAIFGFNFQTVNVAQKRADGGYTDADGTPSEPLAQALDFVDGQLGRIAAELKAKGEDADTLLVVTAKHGNSPIDPAQRVLVDEKLIAKQIDAVSPGLTAHVTPDDVALIWLTDPEKTQDAVNALQANAGTDHIARILWGPAINYQFGDPLSDSRVPNIIVVPQPGVIYAKAKATKHGEHGGFSHDDTNVALIVANPAFTAQVIDAPVTTTSIAPTTLRALGLNPEELQAVQLEHTAVLPGLGL